MNRAIGAIVVLSSALPLMAQRTVSCSSNDGERHNCPANTRNGVVLLKEYSDNICQQGSTWGYTPRGIYVSGGCSAQFQVGGSTSQNGDNSNGNNGQNGYGSNGNSSRSNGNNNGYGNGQGNNGTGNNGQGNNENGYGNGQGYGNNGNHQRYDAVIPSGTRMDVRLEQAVSSRRAKQGDLIPATLVNDVVVNGNVIARSGTQVQAKVVAAQEGQTSSLSVRLDSMMLNGQEYKLLTNSVHSVRDSQGAQSGNSSSDSGNPGAQIGSILGEIAGNRQGGELPAGSVYSFRLTSPARPGGSSYPSNSR